MPLRQTKCTTPGCPHKRLTWWWSTILVSAVCGLVLCVPILGSMGLTINSSLTASFRITFLTIVLAVMLLISIVMGTSRQHENEWFCIIDSVAIPAIVAAVFFGAKLLG